MPCFRSNLGKGYLGNNMKWFKHQSVARNDEKIAKLEDKCGLEGYGFYFKMLEIVAEFVDSSDRHEATFSLTRWGRQANITSKKFLFLSSCCSDVGLMSVQRVGDDITVKIPNLLKYRDNHTKNLQVASKQDKDKEIEKEVEIEKEKEADKEKQEPAEKLPDGPTKEELFEIVWKAYPKRSGDNPKKRAFEAWSARLKSGCTHEQILDGVNRYRSWCEATGKVGSETVKHAATFFGPEKSFLEPWAIPPKKTQGALNPERPAPVYIPKDQRRAAFGNSDAIDSTAKRL